MSDQTPIRPPDTPANYRAVAWGCFGVALVSLAILGLGFSKLGESSILVLVITALVSVGWGTFALRQASHAASGQDIVASPRAPSDVNARVAQLKRGLWLQPIAWTVATVWTYYNLHLLETSQAYSARLFAPLVVVYDLFGFWPTVLTPVAFGVLFFAVTYGSLRKIRREASRTKS